VRAAFVRHPDEVALLVERIRASEHHVPRYSLVAEDESGIVGFVMLSWIGVEGGARPRVLNLSPLAVRPDRQGRGVGAALTREALARAEADGEPAIIVEGIPAYYPRFGFERASARGWQPDNASIPDAAFMIARLPGYTDDLAGRVRYPPAFGHLGDA
jgi:putative acetyltransferase